MASILDNYSDDVDETSATATKQFCNISEECTTKKKYAKKIKALTKAIRKQNELLEQEAERRKAEEAAAAEAARLRAEKAANKRNRSNGARGFLTKLEDAICKSIPKVLTTLATLAFSWFVKTKLDRRSPQAA